MNLTIGIFFDGTGNNIRDTPRQKISNVAKLYKVYGKEGDNSVANAKVAVIKNTLKRDIFYNTAK